VGLDEILYEDDDTEGGLGSILVNPVASTIPKWWTLKLLWWIRFLNRLVDLDEILCGGYDAENDIDSILLDLVSLTIPKQRTFKRVRWCKF
jgi:hypothetical protein